MVSIRLGLRVLIVCAGMCTVSGQTPRSLDAADLSPAMVPPPDSLIEVYCPTRVRITIDGQPMTATGRYRVFRFRGSHPPMVRLVSITATMPPRWRGCEPEVDFAAEPIWLRPGERRVVVFHESDFLPPCEVQPQAGKAPACQPNPPATPSSNPGELHEPPPPNPSGGGL